jgi:hypothetical protein
MAPKHIISTDLGRLRENLIDLELAIADAYREAKRDDPRVDARLDELIRQHAAHIAALQRHELRVVRA